MTDAVSNPPFIIPKNDPAVQHLIPHLDKLPLVKTKPQSTSISTNPQHLTSPGSLPLIACAIMVKNEEKQIIRTMESVYAYIDLFVILDTGSTDKTMDIIKDFCKVKNKRLYLYEKTFKDEDGDFDFSESRNYMLQRCKGKSEFILLMDANDEGKHPEIMRLYLTHVYPDKQKCVFSVPFKLDNDVTEGATASYSRLALIRNGHQKNIYYIQPTHEQLITDDPVNCMHDITLVFVKPVTFSMYQDRALDKPSDTRYEGDIRKLEKFGKKVGFDARIYHYLCQTTNNQHNNEKLFNYSEELIKFDLPDKQEYSEYIFFGYIHNGVSRKKLGKPDWQKSLLKAYNYSKKLCERVEPLYICSVIYLQEWQDAGRKLVDDMSKGILTAGEIKEKEAELKNILTMGYEYAIKACKVPFPTSNTRLSSQIDLMYWRGTPQLNNKGQIVGFTPGRRAAVRDLFEKLLYITMSVDDDVAPHGISISI